MLVVSYFSLRDSCSCAANPIASALHRLAQLGLPFDPPQLPCRSAAAGAGRKTLEREQIREAPYPGDGVAIGLASPARIRELRADASTVSIIRRHRARSHRSFSTQRSATDDGLNRAPEAAEESRTRCYGETAFRSPACRASRDRRPIAPAVWAPLSDRDHEYVDAVTDPMRGVES